jgi:hypothetical protein
VSLFGFDTMIKSLMPFFVAWGYASSRSFRWTWTHSWRVGRRRGQDMPLRLPVIESLSPYHISRYCDLSAPHCPSSIAHLAVQLDADHHWHNQPQFVLLRWPFRTIFWIPFSYARYEFVLLIGCNCITRVIDAVLLFFCFRMFSDAYGVFAFQQNYCVKYWGTYIELLLSWCAILWGKALINVHHVISEWTTILSVLRRAPSYILWMQGTARALWLWANIVSTVTGN